MLQLKKKKKKKKKEYNLIYMASLKGNIHVRVTSIARMITILIFHIENCKSVQLI